MDPEADTLQWIIQPACRDAEVCLVWRNMMDAMVSFGKDDVHLLQEFNPGRQARICVGPFVDLVGESDEQSQGHQEPERGKPLPNDVTTECLQQVHNYYQPW